jgi:hypothetical protein
MAWDMIRGAEASLTMQWPPLPNLYAPAITDRALAHTRSYKLPAPYSPPMSYQQALKTKLMTQSPRWCWLTMLPQSVQLIAAPVLGVCMTGRELRGISAAVEGVCQFRRLAEM